MSPRNRSASAAAAPEGGDGGDARRQQLGNSSEPALLRLCPSSPMCSASAISARRSMPSPPAERLGEQRRHASVHPAQAIEHLGGVGAVAQHLAVPLVEVGEGAPAVVVLGDPRPRRPHRRRDDAGHRADGGVVVAGLEGDLRRSAASASASASSLAHPSKSRAPIDRTAQRPRHPLPLDRRAGVEEETVAQAGDDVARPGDHSGQHRPRRHHARRRRCGWRRRCRFP